MSKNTSTRLPLLAFFVSLVAIAVMVNYLSFRHYKRWDWTTAGVFTLSERSVEMLRSLEQDVDIYVFLGIGETEFADIDELLEQYKAQSQRVRVHRVDPDREQAKYKILADRFGLSSVATDVGMIAPIPIVVATIDGQRKIERDQLIKQDFESQGELSGAKISLESERALTGAILGLSVGEETKICVSQGHGEWELSGAGRRSLIAMSAELDWEHVAIEAVVLTGSEAVPETCDALFVIGPLRAFGPPQVQALATFLDQGGGVLLALDPVLDKKSLSPTGLESLLSERGVTLGQDLVLELSDRHLLSPSPLEAFIAADFSEHRVVDEIRGAGGGIAFGVVRSVRPTQEGLAQTLVRASQASYGETDPPSLDNVDMDSLGAGPDDTQGPVSLAVALHDETTRGRLVVIGDADWLLADYLQTPQFSNVDLLSSVTGWLGQRESLISIAPRQTDAQSVIMTEEDLDVVLVRVVGLLPLSFLIAGLGVWWSRRS